MSSVGLPVVCRDMFKFLIANACLLVCDAMMEEPWRLNSKLWQSVPARLEL
jgi:hypothetical protein